MHRETSRLAVMAAAFLTLNRKQRCQEGDHAASPVGSGRPRVSEPTFGAFSEISRAARLSKNTVKTVRLESDMILIYIYTTYHTKILSKLHQIGMKG